MKKAEKLKTLSQTLEHLTQKHIQQVLCNIIRILSIILTTLPTSAGVERANSVLRYAQIDFQNTMSEDRFNSLLLLYVYRDIKLDYKKIVDMHVMRYPRSMA